VNKGVDLCSIVLFRGDKNKISVPLVGLYRLVHGMSSDF